MQGKANRNNGVLLPVEIIVKILRVLNLRHLLRCRLVCKGFRDIIDVVPELQYSVELGIAGCVESGDSALDTPERRELLRQHRQTSRYPDLTWRPCTTSLNDEIDQAFRNGARKPIYNGNVFLSPTVSGGSGTLLQDGLHCFALVPCTTQKREGDVEDGSVQDVMPLKWTRRFDKPFTCFDADPGQNLLVLSEVEPLLHKPGSDNRATSSTPVTSRLSIRICSLSPGGDDDARVIVPLVDVFSVGLSSLQIHGNTIAVVLMGVCSDKEFELGDPKAYRTEIILIDRRSQKITSRWRHPYERMEWTNILAAGQRQTCNVAFLDETTFLVVFRGQTYDTVSVYTVLDTFSPSPSEPDEGLLHEIAHVATFQLPPFRLGTTYSLRDLCYTTSYSRGYKPRPGHSHEFDGDICTPQAGTPLRFEVAPEACLFHINLLYTAPPPENPNDRHQSMEVYQIFQLAPFFDAVDAYKAGFRGDGHPPLIPWAVWGPQNSRTLQMPPHVVNAFGSHGSRVMFTHQAAAGTESMLDFNTLQEARDESRGVEISVPTGQRFVGADNPTVIPKGDIFLHDIVGRLPYRETMTVSTEPFAMWRGFLGGEVWITNATLQGFHEKYQTLIV